jgi:hypothetical protein
VLTDQDDHPRTFARLTRADRRSILEILKETKSTLPAFWQPELP